MQTALDFDRVFAALADATRRDIVRRAIAGEEGVAELAGHYPMSFAAVQKHIAVLERAGLVGKERIGPTQGRPHAAPRACASPNASSPSTRSCGEVGSSA